MTNLSKTFIVLSLTCGAAWLTKQAAIAASGGKDAESPLIATLWATGMITFVLASATGTALALHRLPTWARVVAGVAAAPTAFLALQAMDGALDAVYPGQGWFAQEIPLVVAALVVSALGMRSLNLRHSAR